MGDCNARNALSRFRWDSDVHYEREVSWQRSSYGCRALLIPDQVCRALRIAALLTVRAYLFPRTETIESDTQCRNKEARV